MSLSFSMANFVLKEDFEKFIKTISITHLRNLYMQRTLTWQKEYIAKELRSRELQLKNLMPMQAVTNSNTRESDDYTKLIATYTWY